jgi:hypothetical protein
VRQARRLQEITIKVGNQHPQLLLIVDEYSRLINGQIDTLDVVDLWAVGNALMAQSISFERQNKDRTFTEPLEPDHLGTLIEVSALHGGFILGFPKAAELVARADNARIGPDLARVIEAPTSHLLGALARQRRFLTDRARELIEALDAALFAGAWDSARIGYTSYATTRNALLTIGKLTIWINDKGGSLAGSTVIAATVAAANLPPETLQLVLDFLRLNASNILSFAAPFPELRAYFEWIINHFDLLEGKGPAAKSE